MSQTLTYVIGQDRRPHVDNVQDFKVNFDGSNTNWVQARQYERSMRQVFVNIKNEDGTPLDLTGCNVWFEGLLPKNSAGDFRIIDDKGYVALDPTAGRFRFDMPGHAFTVAGSYRQAFFRIVKDGNSITTLEFDLDVLADKVIDGLVPRTYISPVEELINEIETKYQDSTDKLTKMASDFVDQFTQSMNTLKALGVTVQNGLDALEAKIKQDNLFTQAEADAFKTAIQSQLDKEREKINDAISTLQGKFPDYAKETADFAGHDLMHNGHIAVYKKTFGKGKDASGMSVMVNSDDDPEVQNNSLDWIAKHYTGRDSAAIYASNTRIPYLFTTTDTKFTENSVTVLDESIDLSDVKPGMLIDTSVRANIDKDWYVTSVVSVEGRTINTNLWYKVQSNPNAETVTGTPADGLAITVNPMIGVWGANFNVYIPQEDAAAGTALELGVYSKSKVPQDIVGLRITSGGEFINNGAKITGSYSNAYDAVNVDGGTAYNVDPDAKVDYYFRAQNPDKSANWFVNNRGQLMHESIVPHFATDASGDYGKDDSLIIFNGNGDQTINLDYGRYGRLVRVVAMSDGTKTIYAKPESSSMSPGTSWFLDSGNSGENTHSLALNKSTGKVAVTLLDAGNVFVVL
ncbi:phage baseplate upper protein [Limosilactobacillus reuteri]|uniref:phage baseplate upper protein n=2 Tax=Limosilactobacillus reuteri TaxID=1598 RepID=UPI00399354BC